MEKKIKKKNNRKSKINLFIQMKSIHWRHLQTEITPLRIGFPEGPVSSAWPVLSASLEATPWGLLEGSSGAALLARYLQDSVEAWVA